MLGPLAFEPKGAGRIAPVLAPSGSLLRQPFSYHGRGLWQARDPISSAPIPQPAGPENLQCRAAFTQIYRVVVSPQPDCWERPTRFGLAARSDRLQRLLQLH